MTSEIQEKLGDHITATKPQVTEELPSHTQAIDEGGGDNRSTAAAATSSPSITTTTETDSYECSSSNNNNTSCSNNNNSQIKLSFTKAKPIVNGKCHQLQQQHLSDAEEGFLSTSPDSANEELLLTKPKSNDHKDVVNGTTAILINTPSPPTSIYTCSTGSTDCVSIKNILECFKAALSEEQAWALIYQTISLYRRIAAAGKRHIFNDLEIPDAIENLNLHRDGSVHCSWTEAERKKKEQKLKQQQERQRKQQQVEQSGGGDDNHAQHIASHKKILRNVAVIVYNALDYNLHEDEQCQMSQELEELITHMTEDETDDDCIDEGIDEGYKRWDDEHDETKEFDYVLEACKNHIKPTVPEEHYKAVCRALVTETLELRIFLQQVLNQGADNLHLKADSQTSQQELAKLGFNDWARFWVQVIDELRRGVRLKKANYERAPTEYELTPYEILMEDIRSRKYQLRKVMVNGDIPPRVKKDAHALILEFIRSRPPLKKASERKLPPPIKRTPSPREQLMDSIRKGRTLKHIPSPTLPRLKDRLLPPSTTTTATSTSTSMTAQQQHQLHHHHQYNQYQHHHQQTHSNKLRDSYKLQENMEPPPASATGTTSSSSSTSSRSKQRLIKVDLSLLQDDDNCFDEPSFASTSSSVSTTISGGGHNIGVCSQPKMPPYPIGGYMMSDTVAASRGLKCCNNNNNNNNNNTNMHSTYQQPTTTRVTRRTKDPYSHDDYHRFFDNALESYDLATQCESRRVSARRHTIVGCQSNFDEAQSMPPSRPGSRQSDVHGNSVGADNVSTAKQLHNDYNQQQDQQKYQQQQSPSNEGSNNKVSNSSSSVGPWNKSFMDEKTWNERGDDRLSLTLEEIVHIRSVMTKAELEGLPVGIRVKEDVEKRKICFLCLRTRFSIFGPWGIQCKICQRTVCSKCYTKMRIPSEHFRNVPLVLISPSLLASPAGSSTPSPSHHARYMHSSSTGNILDETFPKSLIERLMGSEAERKARNSVGSAPSSPKHQRSNMSTPGILAGDVDVDSAAAAAGQAVEAIHDTTAMTMSYTSGTTAYHSHNQHRQPTSVANGGYNCKENQQATANNRHFSIMSRSMEGPRSLPVHSPASRPHSNSSTLDRKTKFSRAYTLSSSGTQLSQDQERMRGELVPVCNDCRGLVMEISRSAKQKRSSARNRTLKNLTLDLSPVWK